jgi:hypothetical protein
MNDLQHRQYKAIMKVIEELPTEEFISLFNQYVVKDGCDNAMMPMRELDLLLEDASLRDILHAVNYRRFDADDDYYYWDYEGTLCSWDGSKYDRPEDFDEDIAEFCTDFEEDFGIPEIAKILAWREEEE